MLDAGHALSREQIAADWYDRVYLPAVEAIHRERLHEAYPEETDGDLFLFVHRRRRELAARTGLPPVRRGGPDGRWGAGEADAASSSPLPLRGRR
jgi:hypothetical protein